MSTQLSHIAPPQQQQIMLQQQFIQQPGYHPTQLPGPTFTYFQGLPGQPAPPQYAHPGSVHPPSSVDLLTQAFGGLAPLGTAPQQTGTQPLAPGEVPQLPPLQPLPISSGTALTVQNGSATPQSLAGSKAQSTENIYTSPDSHNINPNGDGSGDAYRDPVLDDTMEESALQQSILDPSLLEQQGPPTPARSTSLGLPATVTVTTAGHLPAGTGSLLRPPHFVPSAAAAVGAPHPGLVMPSPDASHAGPVQPQGQHPSPFLRGTRPPTSQ